MFQCYLSHFILLADILNCTNLKTGEFLQYCGFTYIHQSLQYFLQFKNKMEFIFYYSFIKHFTDARSIVSFYQFFPVQSSNYVYFNDIYILMTQIKLHSKIFMNIFIQKQPFRWVFIINISFIYRNINKSVFHIKTN